MKMTAISNPKIHKPANMITRPRHVYAVRGIFYLCWKMSSFNPLSVSASQCFAIRSWSLNCSQLGPVIPYYSIVNQVFQAQVKFHFTYCYFISLFKRPFGMRLTTSKFLCRFSLNPSFL